MGISGCLHSKQFDKFHSLACSESLHFKVSAIEAVAFMRRSAKATNKSLLILILI